MKILTLEIRLPNHCILVHACCDPDVGLSSAECGCRSYISKVERDARVAAGELFVLDERAVVEKRNVLHKPVFKTPHQARTIQGRDIVRAFGFNDKDGHEYEKQRICLFEDGALKKSILDSRSKR